MGFKKKINSLFLNKKTSYLVVFFLLFIITYFVYHPALFSYFFQDDWFTFSISEAKYLKDFLFFFTPRLDVIYYRPLGMQVYFFVMKSVFGINPIYFRLSTFLIYTFNGLLIYKLLEEFKFSKKVSLFSAIIYTGSVVTYIPFFWSATFPFVLGPTFFLLSFLSYIKSNNFKLKILSFVFFFYGLLTLEEVVILPGILIIWDILNRKDLAGKIKYWLLFILPILPYVYLRLIAFPVPLEETYTVKISFLSTIRSYLLWSFNWAEEIVRQFVAPFILNKDFIRSFSYFINIWLIETLVFILIFFILPFFLKLKDTFGRKLLVKLFTKIEIIGISIYVLGLVPLILFSNHTYPYYLPIPLIGFAIFIAFQTEFLLGKIKNQWKGNLIIISLILLWLFASRSTIKFNELTHWAPRRAILAKNAVTIYKQNEYLNPTVFIKDLNYKYATRNGEALKIIYGDEVRIINTVKEIPSNKIKDKNIIIL